jgi:hypothetical protein
MQTSLYACYNFAQIAWYKLRVNLKSLLLADACSQSPHPASLETSIERVIEKLVIYDRVRFSNLIWLRYQNGYKICKISANN